MVWAYVLAGGLAGGLLSATAEWLMARRAGAAAGLDAWRRWLRPVAPASPQVLILVAVCAALSGYLWLRLGPSPRLIVVSSYVWLLVLIMVIDIKQRRVYNGVLVMGAVIALAASLLAPPPGLASALMGGVAGLVILGIVTLVFPRGMGAGDAKLAGVIGLMVGFPGVLVALVAGIFAGGILAFALLTTRLAGRRSYIPYAPCLAFGAIVALIHGRDILAWYLSRLGG